MALNAPEFIRRFALHILPRGFVRIRHYGILSSKTKVISLPVIRDQLQHKQQPTTDSIIAPCQKTLARKCPCCKKRIMQHMMDFDFRGPPSELLLKELLKYRQKSNILKNAV
jgi:hypothetical protein